MKKLLDAFRVLYDGDNILKITKLRYVPRWLVIIIDVLIVLFSIVLSSLFLEKLHVRDSFPEYTFQKIGGIILINLLFMFVYKTYAGIIRHSTFFDFFKIMFSSGSTLVTLLTINYCTEILVGKAPYLYPNLFLY
ncbi:MAG: polysaccharide biosynthesis protein, partial [Chryseobacterium sp.]